MRATAEASTARRQDRGQQAEAGGEDGGEDQGIPASAVEELDHKLDQASVPHRLNLYPGAPHSFFDRHMEKFATESEDAWRQMLAFIRSGAI